MTPKEYKEETILNATKFSLALPVAVVSRLLLGHPGPMTAYQQIAESVDLTNRYLMKRMLKQPKSKEEQENHPKAISVLKAAIDASFQSQEEGSFHRQNRSALPDPHAFT